MPRGGDSHPSAGTGRAGSSASRSQKGWPNASNTGVPPRTSLAPVNGDVTLDTPGETYSERLVNGCISVKAPNVTIRRVKIVCTDQGGIDNASTGLVVEDTEIDMGNMHGRTAFGGSNVTARRVNAHGGENIVWVEHNVTIEDSYIHDPIDYDPAIDPHTDAIQMPTGASNITIDHNTIAGNFRTANDPDTPQDEGSFGNSAITLGGDTSNITIVKNKLAGGGYTLRCADAAGSRGFTVVGNRFSTMFVRSVGGYGPTDGSCARFAAKYRGNVYLDGPHAGGRVERASVR